jgi:ATP-dependent protease ClpP protease subunit
MAHVLFIVLSVWVIFSSEISFAQVIPEGFIEYKIKEGDVLEKIAPHEHWNLIRKVNRIDDRHLIIGKKILLSKYGESMQFTDGILPYPIKLHINSPGGEAYSSLALYDFIKNFDIPIVGVVEGMAASGASLVLCGCHFKTMTENSVILAHEVRSVKGLTKYTEEKDAFANDNELMDKLKKIYLAETKVSKKDIDDILSHDRYWDADKCLKIGFIDAIIGREEKKVTHKKTTKKSKTSKNNPSIEKQESVESKDDSSIEKPEKPESISIKNSD